MSCICRIKRLRINSRVSFMIPFQSTKKFNEACKLYWRLLNLHLNRKGMCMEYTFTLMVQIIYSLPIPRLFFVSTRLSIHLVYWKNICWKAIQTDENWQLNQFKCFILNPKFSNCIIDIGYSDIYQDNNFHKRSTL